MWSMVVLTLTRGQAGEASECPGPGQPGDVGHTPEHSSAQYESPQVYRYHTRFEVQQYSAVAVQGLHVDMLTGGIAGHDAMKTQVSPRGECGRTCYEL